MKKILYPLPLLLLTGCIANISSVEFWDINRIIWVSIAMIFLGVLIYFATSTNQAKKHELARLQMSIEERWSCDSMNEHKNKAFDFINEDILKKEEDDPETREKLSHSKKIVTFFDKLGIQIYQGLIPAKYVIDFFGKEILEYWDSKNYKSMVYFDRQKDFYKDLYPWAGFEYLASLSGSQMQPDYKFMGVMARKNKREESYIFALYILGIIVLLAIGTYLLNTVFGGCAR